MGIFNSKNRYDLKLEDTDVAFIFKEDGHIDISFPDLHGAFIPDHVMTALLLSHAVLDQDFYDLIQERYAKKVGKLASPSAKVES